MFQDNKTFSTNDEKQKQNEYQNLNQRANRREVIISPRQRLLAQLTSSSDEQVACNRQEKIGVLRLYPASDNLFKILTGVEVTYTEVRRHVLFQFWKKMKVVRRQI